MSDTTPPTLTAVGLQNVDVTNGPATLSFSAGATDDTGVDHVVLTFDHSWQGASGPQNTITLSNLTDSFADGTSALNVFFGANSTAETYSITSAQVFDTSGNVTTYSSLDLFLRHFPTSFSIINHNLAPTAVVNGPSFLTEDHDTSGALSLTLSNVSDWSGNVSMSFSGAYSTATNGVDVQVPTFSGQYSVNQSGGDYTIDLPSFSILEDQVPEGTEYIAITIHADGQIFATGTDTETVLISLIDSGQTGTNVNDTLNGTQFSDWLRGFGGDDHLLGFAGNDTLDAATGNDVLTGGAGNDTMSGGPGHDTFIDDGAGLNGDTITDLQVGDRIVVSDATTAGFTFSFANNVLSFGATSISLSGVNPGANFLVRSAAEGGVELAIEPQFGGTNFNLSAFGAAQGWTSNNINPRMLADVNGDGNADIVGFGNDGVYVSLASTGGSFAAPVRATTAFGADAGAGGWTSSNLYPRQVADVNGDHRGDIIGFGSDGVYVALGQADGSFAAPHAATTAFGQAASAGGWSSNDQYPRVAADVNGDSRTDIIGFGNDGVYVSLGQADGSFADPHAATTAFGYADYAGGWSSNDKYPREVADVNGDGRADIVGFGNNGVYVSLGQTDGTFADPIMGLAQFGAAPPGGSWLSQTTYPRELADVNGDHHVDLVGFGNDGVFIALGNGDGTFQPSMLDVSFFGASAEAGGWTSQDAYPRLLADVNHDGAADIVGFAGSGVYVAYSNGDIWS